MIRQSSVCAIVLAAGFGRRMKIKYPKQYYVIKGKTILEYSISTLFSNSRISKIVIVISPGDMYFPLLNLSKHPKIDVVNGGKERINSVIAGIKTVKLEQWVLVHDSVRPCLHQNDLSKLLTISEKSNVGGILAIPVRDTIKRAIICKKIISNTVNRDNLWHALTPQFFPRKLLYKCLLRAMNEDAVITDEASALEYCGFHPKLIKGRSDNIKVTYQEDLQLVKHYLIKNKKIKKRI